MIKILTGSYLEYTYIFGQVTARNEYCFSSKIVLFNNFIMKSKKTMEYKDNIFQIIDCVCDSDKFIQIEISNTCNYLILDKSYERLSINYIIIIIFLHKQCSKIANVLCC